MKKITLLFVLLACWVVNTTNAQTMLRYRNEVFTNAQITTTPGITYGTNLNWLIINQTDLKTPSNAVQVGTELLFLKTKVAMNQVATIPMKYYLPKSTPPGDSTILKITSLKMNVYAPIETGVKRPVVIYLHTGNFIPAGLNGSPCGDKSDSVVVDLCKGFARRGFVAFAIDYRLGWLPTSTDPDVRRASLLNAVYRAIQDTKECVRYIKANGNTYSVDTTKICIVGEGTGAYIAHAYNTMDKYPEFMALPKFMGYIDTAAVGYIDGYGGPKSLNLYMKSSVSTKVKAVGTLGGALADTTWLEAGDAPTISMQCVRDPFAPFGYGLVTVPPPYNYPVVYVDGANNTIMRAYRLGNNRLFDSIKSKDPYTTKARSLYNRTVDYIRVPPEDKIFIRSGEGMYPFLLPKAAKEFDNQASPYQWWDPNAPLSKLEIAPGITTHDNAITSNPDMSKAKSKLYQDTIHGYMTVRLAYSMGLLTAGQLDVKNVGKVTGVSIYPNPASNSFTVSYKDMINSITVTDISGKVVYHTAVNKISFTTSSLNLTQGLYIVNIATEQGNAVEKLVIK